MALFSSDTAAPAHPAILAAMAAASNGPAASYGADPETARARDRLCEVFSCDLEVWFAVSGTAANALGLSVLCPPAGAILCHREAHIERDERGAPEFFTGGGKLNLLAGEHAKIDPAGLDARLAANQPGFVHETPACVLSVSNLTECGASYSAEELSELAGKARGAGLKVHLDGARFANAIAGRRVSPAALSWMAGVDVMSFGATKNGALGCEAILLFGEARGLASDLRVRAKRSGHMPPKMRFIAAQMAAYLEGGLWLDLAGHANAMARRLAAGLLDLGAELAHPVDGNEVFVRMDGSLAGRLARSGAGAYAWPDGSWRLVCAWSTRPEDVDGLLGSLMRGC